MVKTGTKEILCESINNMLKKKLVEKTLMPIENLFGKIFLNEYEIQKIHRWLRHIKINSISDQREDRTQNTGTTIWKSIHHATPLHFKIVSH